MARRTKNDWILGINEIRRLMPHWPEEMVQDYFHKGFEDEVNLPVDHFFMGPTHVDTCRDVEPTDGNVPIYDAESGLWCPGDIDQVDPCFCFEIPEQDCEEIEQSCTAIDDFFEKFGFDGLYLSRNYEEDASPGGGNTSAITSIVGPSGTVNSYASGDLVNGDLDTCGLPAIGQFGGSDPTTVINLSSSPLTGSPNQFTMSAIVVPADGTSGVASKGLFSVVSTPQTVQTRIAWNPVVGRVTVVAGSSGTNPEFKSTLLLDGPIGYDAEQKGVPTAIWVTVTRTSTSVSATVRAKNVNSSASKSTNDEGNSLASQSWWVTDLSGLTWRWGWGKNALASGLTGFFLYTGLSNSLPPENYIGRLLFEIERNRTTFVCEEPPPIVEGSVPFFDQDTDSFVLRPVLPPDGTAGQYLVKSVTEPYYSQWQDLPITGGTTGQHLTKASDDEYDVQWVQRDAKTFTQNEDPTVGNTVLAGDLWLQGGIG